MKLIIHPNWPQFNKVFHNVINFIYQKNIHGEAPMIRTIGKFEIDFNEFKIKFIPTNSDEAIPPLFLKSSKGDYSISVFYANDAVDKIEFSSNHPIPFYFMMKSVGINYTFC